MFKKIFLVLGIILMLGARTLVVKAEECQEKPVEERVECYENKLKETQGKKKTLANTIAYLDGQISLKKAEIDQTEEELKVLEEEIAILSVKIDRLDLSLNDVSLLLITRVGEIYKRSHFKSIYMLFSSSGFGGFWERLKYLQAVQINDRKLLVEMQTSRDLHQQQKGLLEKKQTQAIELQQQLSGQKIALGGQKAVKADLLLQTKNDEQLFQRLLATARAEYIAIQAIIAGRGEETKVGHVNAGDKIASIIQGGSCNSSGAHTHFMVSKNGVTENPFSYLGNIDHVNCSGGGACNSGDPFNPSGNWSWPINPQVRFSQGYGVTWATQNIPWIWYDFHNGIDINNKSSSVVKAVRNGTLYQGSYIGGCTLKYVRVDHDNSDLETLYLHINY